MVSTFMRSIVSEFQGVSPMILEFTPRGGTMDASAHGFAFVQGRLDSARAMRIFAIGGKPNHISTEAIPTGEHAQQGG